MSHGTILNRREGCKFEPTFLTEGLLRTLVGLWMEAAFAFYADFFKRSAPPVSKDTLEQYLDALREGIALGLFRAGGISEKDHLSFWCLGEILRPHHYIESGVFVGSSLHAFLKSVETCHVVAIHPGINTCEFPSLC